MTRQSAYRANKEKRRGIPRPFLPFACACSCSTGHRQIAATGRRDGKNLSSGLPIRLPKSTPLHVENGHGFVVEIEQTGTASAPHWCATSKPVHRASTRRTAAFSHGQTPFAHRSRSASFLSKAGLPAALGCAIHAAATGMSFGSIPQSFRRAYRRPTTSSPASL